MSDIKIIQNEFHFTVIANEEALSIMPGANSIKFSSSNIEHMGSIHPNFFSWKDWEHNLAVFGLNKKSVAVKGKTIFEEGVKFISRQFKIRTPHVGICEIIYKNSKVLLNERDASAAVKYLFGNIDIGLSKSIFSYQNLTLLRYPTSAIPIIHSYYLPLANDQSIMRTYEALANLLFYENPFYEMLLHLINSPPSGKVEYLGSVKSSEEIHVEQDDKYTYLALGIYPNSSKTYRVYFRFPRTKTKVSKYLHLLFPTDNSYYYYGRPIAELLRSKNSKSSA